jgi:acyl-coenzyme A synthetase/AMP-(fatty) acid ligase/thioesterase domain-containing protein/acyl carrier protein
MSQHSLRTAVDCWRLACAKYPGNIAIEDGVVQWTYHELETRVDAWSVRIAELPASAATLAIHLPHHADGIAALLGTLEAGKAFVALDRTGPVTQRLAQLEFCEANTLACQPEDQAALRDAGWNGIAILPESPRCANGERINIQPHWTACFHFTSGSSGTPKAVAVPHHTVACAAAYLRTMFEFTSTDRHALLSPLAVPATTAQVLAILSAGATLCLFEARKHSAAEIAVWLGQQGITTVQTVPSLFRKLARDAAGRQLWPRLRAVKLGGEAATACDARLFAACMSENAMLINGLGLTEAGFNVCWWTWHPGEALDGQFLPLGRPPASLELLVEPSPGTLASNGQEGEIVVRSPALPTGYWHDPKRSAVVYRDLPGRPGWRELRTRDVGRWNSDGLLEYRGRSDETVKIRGHRVVPSEIEAALSAIEEVMTAAVVTRSETEKTCLQAFVQLRPNARLKPADLRRKLSTRLPGCMVPAQIHLIDSLPYLPNGKIDRLCLSEKGTALGADREVPPEPADLLTTQLLRIWQEALGCKQIGTKDDFFGLGGDSLAGAAMSADAEKFLGINLPGAALLEAPTVEKLADLIRNGGWKESDLRMVPLRSRGSRPPLYCVPGAGCDFLEFRALANHLSDDQPVFAFQPRGLDGRSSCQRSVEEMAESYVGAIRLHQPRGPYYLCGNSFGGVVAFEMARRLLAEGDEVKFLGLLDSYGGKYPKRRQQLAPRKMLKLALRHFLPLNKKNSFTLSSFSRGLMQWGARRLVDLALFLNVPAPRRPHKLRFFYVEEVCLLARQRYQLKPFHGRIHLFRAEHQPPSDLFEPDPVLGWGAMATGGIEIHELSGYHRAYLWEPGVAVLAGKLTSCLAAATGSNVGLDSRYQSPASNEHEPAVSQ